MKRKVIIWGPGYIGSRGIYYALRHPGLELIGVKCNSADKVGVDVADLCGMDSPTGITATDKIEEILALGADCVIYTPGDPTLQNPLPGTLGYEFILEICQILEAGVNVVATTPVQMVYPRFMGAAESLTEMLNGAAEKGNSSVHFVGAETGFISDSLALIAASMSMDITSIRTFELLDYASWDNKKSARELGFGCPPNDSSRPMILETIKQAWTPSIQEIADTLKVKLDEIVIWDRPIIAEQDFISPGGISIPSGTVAVQHWAVEGCVSGVPRIAVEHVNRMKEDLAPELPSLHPNGGYRIEVESRELPLSLDFHIGYVNEQNPCYHSFVNAMYGTVARAINAVDAICSAPSGLKSKEELGQITCTNAMWLS